MKKIKKLLTIGLAVLLMLCMSLVACDKTSSIPDGYYWFALDNTTFEHTQTDIKNSYGWVIDGDTAELWTSGMCEYKAKIVEKDGEILFDGYQWRNVVDVLLGDTDKRGSNRDYTVVYDETTVRIALTPKLPQENAEYVFDGITFEKSNGLKVEHLSRYIPITQASIKAGEIKTVKDFEKLILDNLDTYRLVVHENGVNKYVYFTPKYHSITVKTDKLLTLRYKDGEGYSQEDVSYLSTTNGNIWTYILEDFSLYWDSESTFSYRISFPMEDSANYFKVVYNYKIK